MRRGPATVAVVLAMLSGAARADDGSPEGEAYQTVVTVESTPAEGVNVQTVSREEVEQSGARSVADLLDLQPAIHATSGSRGERIFTLRGFEQRQVVVLVDGSPAYIPYDGQADLGAVPAALVDHITVIKGPGSVLYGPGGMGGAVNIVTRRPGHGPLAEWRVGTGRGDAYEAQGYHTYRLGRLAYAVHGGLTHWDGLPLSSRFTATRGENGALRENSDRHVYHLGGRALLSLPRGHELEAGVTYVDGNRGVPPSTLESVAQFWRFSVWRGLSLSAGHRGRFLDGGALQVDELVYATLFDNLLDSYDDAGFDSQLTPRAFSSWYHDRIYGGRARLRYRTTRTPWGPTALRLWAGVQHERHRREDDDGVRAAVTREIVTVAPEAELFLGERWRLLAAFQLDVELPGADDLDTRVGPGPLAALRFEPLRQLMLQATFARRYRFPTLKERFSASTTGLRLPNPGLSPEGAWHVGLEGEWRPRPWLVARAALFDAEVEDLIEQVHMGGGVTQMQNVEAARLLGAEISVELHPTRWLAAGLGYGWLHARRVAADEDRLEYRPAHKVVLSARLSPRPWLELGPRLRVVGPQSFIDPATTDRWGTLGTYAVLDARLVVRPRPWLELYLDGQNLTDANHQTEYGFPDPGLRLWVGLALRAPG